MGAGPEALSLERAEGPWAQAAACSAQGPRPSNEDYHVILCKGLQAEPSAKPEPTLGGLFDDLPEFVAGPSLPAAETASVDCLFAVLDGHGGSAPAQLCAGRLPAEMREQLEASGRDTADACQMAVQETCLALDRHIRFKLGPAGAKDCGTTCVFCFAWQDDAGSGKTRLLLGNLGDSRGLVLRACNGGGHKLELETSDHSPDVPREKDRIQKAGGTVEKFPGSRFDVPRVNGLLGCSRALGDFRFKEDPALVPEQQMVSTVPDVYEFSCDEECVVVLACDGVFDVLSSVQVASIVSTALEENENDVGDAALAVVQAALSSPKQQDNVTCVVAFVGASNA